jgi:hypothetical protein
LFEDKVVLLYTGLREVILYSRKEALELFETVQIDVDEKLQLLQSLKKVSITEEDAIDLGFEKSQIFLKTKKIIKFLVKKKLLTEEEIAIEEL